MVETLRPERDMTENRAERGQDQEIGVEGAKDGDQATAKLTDNPKDGDKEQTIRKEGDEKAAALPSSSGSKANKVQTGKKEEKPKPSKFKEMWEKAGLDVGTCLMMFKGSVAPTIAIAFYQADSVAAHFTTLGYLIPIISVLSMAIMPRAKFFQTLLLNTLGVCMGSAAGLLGIWSGIQARKHTSPVGSKEPYNASQSAVCAIFLFFNIWFVNVLRAKLPALQFPVIMYSIFTNVAFTFGPSLQTTAQGEALIKQLLEEFLTAFGIATGVNLFVIPMSSRTVVFKEMAGYVMAVRGTLKSQTAYLQSLEGSDMFAPTEVTTDVQGKGDGKSKSSAAQNHQAKAFNDAIAGLTTLHGKLHGDLPFGKRETAWGKLNAKDLDEIFALFRQIVIPLIGMSTITDIFKRIAERRGWVKALDSRYDRSESWEHRDEADKDKEKKVWNEVMKALHEPFAVAVAAMDEGMEHAGLVLELLPTPKKKKGQDEEEKGTDPRPGDAEFSKALEQKMLDFYNQRGKALKAWAKERGLSEAQFNAAKSVPPEVNNLTPEEAQHRRDQQQLYLILYMEHLLYLTGIAIKALVNFADQKVKDGTMKKNRLILPGQKRVRKWILSIGREDTSVDTESPDSMETGGNNVYMGSGFNPRKDLEHLPPKNSWERLGNGIRVISHFLGSPESAFGFRVACATLTVGIVAFLKHTQVFFFEQRLVWAMIIIAIGMSMTSGQSIFGFCGRIMGTTLSMIFSIVIWYIVDQKPAGVIVMLWFFIFLEMYFFLRFPRFISIWLVCIITQVLVVGYELQVKKIGIKAASASGQPYYPIFELAPYRLACVAGGSFVAFFWTIFPYPISDRSWLRKDLGSTLYLLANYYSVVHSTIHARMHDTEGDMDSKSSPGRKLEKARNKIMGKLMLLLPSLKMHSDWQKWELQIGGKWPRETYDAITVRVTKIINYLSLMSYTTQSWSKDGGSQYPNMTIEKRRAWINDLIALIDVVKPTSHQITSTLSLLSASVKQGSALPPYIQVPESYNLSHRLEALDKGILDSRHVEDLGYSAYAVMQVASSLLTDDLARLVDHVKDLVGETDFSFSVNVSDSDVDIVGSEGGLGKGKQD